MRPQLWALITFMFIDVDKIIELYAHVIECTLWVDVVEYGVLLFKIRFLGYVYIFILILVDRHHEAVGVIVDRVVGEQYLVHLWVSIPIREFLEFNSEWENELMHHDLRVDCFVLMKYALIGWESVEDWWAAFQRG